MAELRCMICGKEGTDAPGGLEFGKQPLDRDLTEVWIYCRPCDCWTEFPISVLDKPPARANRE